MRIRPLNGVSKRGLPVVYETGGLLQKTFGLAVVICGSEGEPLTPLYVISQHVRPNSVAAVFVARPGMHRIVVWQGNGVLLGRLVERIRQASTVSGNMELIPVDDVRKFDAAIQAAFVKSCTPNCMVTHYCAGPSQSPRSVGLKKGKVGHEILLLP